MKQILLSSCIFFSVVLHASLFFRLPSALSFNESALIRTAGEVIDVKIITSAIDHNARVAINDNKTTQAKKQSGDSKIVSKAKLKGELKISYPPLSKLLKEEGEVTLSVMVNELGKVMKVKILTSSGFFRLDEYAKNKLLKSSFIAAKKNNNGELTHTDDVAILKINFQLD